jgi:hypothetical protein
MIEFEVRMIQVEVIEVKLLEVIMFEVAKLGTVVEATACTTETEVGEDYIVQPY